MRSPKGRIVGHATFTRLKNGDTTTSAIVPRVIVHVKTGARPFRRAWASIVHAYGLKVIDIPQTIGDNLDFPYVTIYDVAGEDLLGFLTAFERNQVFGDMPLLDCVSEITAALDVNIPVKGQGAGAEKRLRNDGTNPITASNRHAGPEIIADGLHLTKRRI